MATNVNVHINLKIQNNMCINMFEILDQKSTSMFKNITDDEGDLILGDFISHLMFFLTQF